MKSAATFILTLLIFQLNLNGAEVFTPIAGVVVNDHNGEFSLYFHDSFTGDYYPVFFEHDPGTTRLSVLMDNRLYHLEPGHGFDIRVQTWGNSVIISWTSSQLSVIQTFTITPGPEDGQPDEIVMRISMINRSGMTHSLGFRALFDTVLGEDSNSHFEVPDREPVRREQEFITRDLPLFWSGRDQSGRHSVYMSFATGQTTLPDRLIFAGWKHLIESGWDYESVQNRSFDVIPYSVNDSAAALFFNPKSVNRDESRDIIFTFRSQMQTDPLSGQAVQAEGQESPSNPQLIQDLEQLDRLMRLIESYLADPVSADSEVLDSLRAQLNQVEERINSY